MPGLIGYMVAIVVTLGGYLAGLHWLVTPPGPWQPDPNVAQIAQHVTKKRLASPIAPAEAAAIPPVAASVVSDIKVASVETAPSVPINEQKPVSAIATSSLEKSRPTIEPAHMVSIKRRFISVPHPHPAQRKLVARKPGRTLELMVLRTYQRSDGKRFTRLLPWTGVRSALALAPDTGW
jgi:hypothetical protein